MISDSMPAPASANQCPHHFQNHGLINACWQSWRWRWIVCQHQESLQLSITNRVGDQLNWLRVCVVTISPNYSITAKTWKKKNTRSINRLNFAHTLIQPGTKIWYKTFCSQVFRVYAVEPDSWFHQLEDTKKGRRLPALLYPSPSVIIILMKRTRQ